MTTRLLSISFESLQATEMFADALCEGPGTPNYPFRWYRSEPDSSLQVFRARGFVTSDQSNRSGGHRWLFLIVASRSMAQNIVLKTRPEYNGLRLEVKPSQRPPASVRRWYIGISQSVRLHPQFRSASTPPTLRSQAATMRFRTRRIRTRQRTLIGSRRSRPLSGKSRRTGSNAACWKSDAAMARTLSRWRSRCRPRASSAAIFRRGRSPRDAVRSVRWD